MLKEPMVRIGRNSGKSKSVQNRNGIRRTDYISGEPLAPRSLRRGWKKRGRPLLSKCSDAALKRAKIEREVEAIDKTE